MPYEGKDIGMLLVLPNEKFGLKKLIGGTDGQFVQHVIQKAKKRNVEVHIRKFCVSCIDYAACLIY